ncbi:5'-methylthioadenosine/S-adenosylhomocysteine nucleosidase [Micromonospora sp. NPDC047074]|uniref:5'-methylthioadenosine/S-adenosylhomocysteine nucleosidase family protein n=1 Tax=Micromonospora sp. NPDC047074 TaxID=3154339 RepID=UPI0033CB575F
MPSRPDTPGGHGVDVVFLTALGLEHDAILAHLVDARPRVDSDGTHYTLGGLPGRGPAPRTTVALALVGEGNLAAAALAGRAIREFRPRALLLVGVAGGLTSDAVLGDVVVATRIHAYQGGRQETGRFRPRPRGWPISHGLEQLARAVARDGGWCDAPAPRVHFKPIVSGDVVLDSREAPVARLIARHYSDATAIDMESAGVAEAAHRSDFHQVITIRGVSDAADGGKRRADTAGWQHRAAANAAGFAVALARAVGGTPRVADGHRDTPATAPAPIGPAPPTEQVPSSGRGAPDERPERVRRIPQLLSAAAVAAVAVLLYLGVSAVVGGGDRPDEPVDAGTGTWAPARSGSGVRLEDWRTLDLETGETADYDIDGVGNLPGMDLALSHDASRLIALGPARVAVLDIPGEAAVDRCLASEEYVDGLHTNLRELLSQGRDVCVRTQEENLAMLTVQRPPSAASARVEFRYTLWKAR